MYEAQSAYDISVVIYVNDNSVPRVFSETTPSEDIVKRVWNVNTIEPMIGERGYTCNDFPDPVVNSLGEVIDNYNVALDPEQQMEFSGDRNGFSPFANDSDNDGSPCDEDEPDHQFVYLLELNVAPR